MKHPVLSLFLFTSFLIPTASASVVWQEDFEGTALGDTSGNNATLAGSTLQTANTASSVVVNASTDPVAAPFTKASGNFIRLSVGDDDFAAVRPASNPLSFASVDDNDRFTLSFDLFIPGATSLDVPVGRIAPRLESNNADGNGLTFDAAEVSAPGQYTITYSGQISDFKNPESAGDADSARPFIYFEQKIDADDDGTTNNFVYLDNIHFEVSPAGGNGGLFVPWGNPQYDDDLWPTGAAPIGYDSSTGNPYALGTNLISMRDSRWSVYMRTTFHLTAAQLASITQLDLTLDYDDGYIAYVNGSEVSRGTMGTPGDFYAHNNSSDDVHNATSDNGNPSNPATLVIDKSTLQVGQNVLAAQLHNATIDSSDLLLSMELSHGSSILVPNNATYSYFIGSSEPPGEPASDTPPHGISLSPIDNDQDANGLPDIWESIYGAQGIDPNSDSDGDGLSNAHEASLGTDPFDPQSRMELEILAKDDDEATLAWTYLSGRPGQLKSSIDLGKSIAWADHPGSPSLSGDKWTLDIPTSSPADFFRLESSFDDADSDGVPDWIEPLVGFSSDPGDADSVYQARSYDTSGDRVPDVSVSGDLAAFNEIYRLPEPGKTLTRAQAARLLLQTTFGPADMAQVDHVAQIGPEAWIDEQIAISPSLTQPYIDAVKADLEASPAGEWSNAILSGYHINDAGSNPYVAGINYMTAWMRSALQGEDQLRQRVAFALSQIVVASRSGAGLPNQPRATANYYDFMIEGAFGNYQDLLLKVSLSPYMGTYLSHIGNQKADPDAGRFPDENYAREIMQLFSIGLWELNPDGTQKLDSNGEPIPTYDNLDITNLAKVFTGMNFASNNFGGGWRDDGDSNDQWMITPMKVFASHHDWSAKSIPIGVDGNGNRLHHLIPANPGGSDADALAEVTTVVDQLVHHPNCAPFVSRQLIQFLVTSNPSAGFVQRVAEVFSNNGSGVTGDLEAVVKAILLDDEARNPLEHLSTPYFGHFREPTLRLVHLARILDLDQYSELLWWDWGYYSEQSLQEPMASPTVFNYYRPDFRLSGSLAENQLDSPGLGIVNSYSSISFTNYLWRVCDEGFEQHGNAHRFWADKQFPEDLDALESLAGNIPELLDHLSILYCAGTLGAESRKTITTVLDSEPDFTDRARLAAFLVLISPEGTCLK